ncbi:MAG: nucleotidyltransferase family protein [Sphingobacteriaceae bacterium]|nr:nucleotidyltransferase family protein [Sphingobacteriaceae bacterium]
MKDFSRNIIKETITVKEALEVLNSLSGKDCLTLFVTNSKGKLIGTLTDGDIRRGLLSGKEIHLEVKDFMNKTFKSIKNNLFNIQNIDELRALEIDLIPFLNEDGSIIKIIDLSQKKSILPLQAVIMAGGDGKRLRPLTNDLPKPLLKVGNKPILEHNIDRLESFGIFDFTITVRYMSEKIENYFSDGKSKGIKINYYHETEPLGTIGALGNINSFSTDTVLVLNSDLLTNIDYEEFYREFNESGADMAIASVPYHVNVPYAVLEVENDTVVSFKEKPVYTYYSSAGIYLIKTEMLKLIPKNQFYNATDLMEKIIALKKKLVYFPIHGYWLDIGQHDDYLKAQEDIKHLKL